MYVPQPLGKRHQSEDHFMRWAHGPGAVWGIVSLIAVCMYVFLELHMFILQDLSQISMYIRE